MSDYKIEIGGEIRIDHRGNSTTNNGTTVQFSCYIDSNIYVDELYLRISNNKPHLWTECEKCSESHVSFPSKKLSAQIVLELLEKMKTYHFHTPLNDMDKLIVNAKEQLEKDSED